MLPDVIDFASDVLMSQGGLVEKCPDGVLVLLPGDAACRIGLPESCLLSRLAHSDVAGAQQVPCNFGTPALERLIDVGRAAVPVAAARLNLEGPRPSHARSLAERFAPRNGLAEVISTGVRDEDYLLTMFLWTVEADDRYEGLLNLVACVDDGAEPDDAFQTQIDPSASSALTPAAGDSERQRMDDLPHRVGRQIGARLEAAITPVIERIRRRHLRDHERISEYFDSMARETMASRRRVDAAALSAKIGHIVHERDAKLRELPNRFAVRTSVTPAAFLWVSVPTANVRIRLRRRKESRELFLRLPVGAQVLDKHLCDGCATATGRPALCDDRLHLLCERCAPSAQGRLKCSACVEER